MKRLESLDALRGFDMLWIMGAPGIIEALKQLWGGDFLVWASHEMHHAEWHGLTIMDLVFPTFLFIAGCSFSLSLAKRRENGETNRRIYKHIGVRTCWMILLGCVYNGLLAFDFDNMRYASVLGRIGLAWMFAALIVMHVSNRKIRLLLPLAILLLYSLMIGTILAPDALPGTEIYSARGSVVGWMDRMFLPGKLYGGDFDPEGLLGIIPAVSTALLGMATGEVLLNKKGYTGSRICGLLAIYGSLLLSLGMIWSLFEPINKSLWSGSFTLISGGIALVFLLLFYWLIDIRGYKKWAFFFRVIGVNSLIIYLGQCIIDFGGIAHYFIGGLASLFEKEVSALILSLGYVSVCWLFLYFLYKQKVFLKI